MKSTFRILIILLFLPGFLMGQDPHDLIFSASDQREKCSECLRLINNKPKEVIWGVDHDSDYKLYFSISSRAFFDKIFNGERDGIAIDIVNRKRYDSSKEVIEKSDIKGSTERNEQLQQERAQSIVSALQSYQKSPIHTKIHTSENWVELDHRPQFSHYKLFSLFDPR